jgi:DNA-binding SARP family transcriptional activator
LSVVFEQVTLGLAVLDASREVVAANRAFRVMLGADGHPPDGRTCCRLFGCRQGVGLLARGCLTEMTLEAGDLSEVPVSLSVAGIARAALIGTSRIDLYGGSVLVEVSVERQGQQRLRGPAPGHMSAFTLGRTRLEGQAGAVSDSWVEQRPAQLLKLLICERHRVVPVEVIAEALWSNASPETLTNVRQCVYAIRRRLEPGRGGPRDTSVITAHRGGYALNRDLVWVDADQFDVLIGRGLSLHRAGEFARARTSIGEALDLYRGDFLSDEPYAEWALLERNRLTALASTGLRTLAAIEIRSRSYEAAAQALEQLTLIDGYDVAVERDLIALCMLRGRRSEARRRYIALRSRLLREFGEEPDFDLADATFLGEQVQQRLLA